MFVLMHVIIALASMVATAFTFFVPSQRRLNFSSVMVGLTIATGTYLVIKTHSSMLSVCLMGLIYIGGSLTALLMSRRKLATQADFQKTE